MLLVVGGPETAAAVAELFSKRGFLTEVVGAANELKRYTDQQLRAFAVAIIDFSNRDGYRAFQVMHAHNPRPVLVGVGKAEDLMGVESLLDATFARPVDPARLFAKVVKLVAARRKPDGRRGGRITGVVGVVEGNALFMAVAAELHGVVPPVNAGAILERTLGEVGAQPKTTEKSHVREIIRSGRLAQELATFGRAKEIDTALASISALLRA